MKVSLKYSLGYYVENIDLEDYGYEEDIKWENLFDEDQHEITDSLLDEIVINVTGETI